MSTRHEDRTMPIFEDSVWQMSFGERAAFEGVLSVLAPALAIELGTAEGASLMRIATYADEVHSFDLVTPKLPVTELANVTIHTGDSHQLLSQVLEEFSQAGRNVDFVLVDGDHSPEGVRRDLEDLLKSPAVGRTVILIHDINNERVRAGVDLVPYEAFPKVAHVDLDFVPGYMFCEQALRHELWGGLGLVIVDAKRVGYFGEPVRQARYYPAAPLFEEIRDIVVAREQGEEKRRLPVADRREYQAALARAGELEARVEELERELSGARAATAHHEALWRSLVGSWSWKLTIPLRLAIRIVRRVTR